MAAEILKSQVNQGRRKELYHFRDQQGLDVDSSFRAPGIEALDVRAFGDELNTRSLRPPKAGVRQSRNAK